MIEIKKNIYWTGIKNWEIREFHGHEYTTHRGSTYNSYVIRDKKTALVDTVWNPFQAEFTQMLEAEIGLENIDYIIINHAEPDHAGSLDYIMSKIPNVPIYCTKNGAEALKRHFHKEWNFNIVKTGDVLSLGEYEIVFVEMPMLHWPDSMLSYVKGANLVLSNDAFGQHYSAYSIFNDEVDQCELYQEAMKYYANILNPFNPLVKRKIDEIKSMNLEIDMIAPSHGVIWRKDPMQIVDKYYEWSQNYNEDFIAIIYDTMYESTKRMADAIACGLEKQSIKYKMFNAAKTDKTELMTEVFKSKGVLVGSCTVNNTILSSVATVLEEMKGLKFKNKFAAAFGSYGWSGEGCKVIEDKLKEGGFNIIEESVRLKYIPTKEELDKCVELGEKISIKFKET